MIFEDVPVTKTAKRSLVILNPYEEPLKVSLTKILKPEFNVDFEWTVNTIPSNSQVSLELVWNPLKVLSSRETIQICDVHGNRKDVAVILKSCELRRATGRKIAPSSTNQRFKQKSPSPTKISHKQPEVKSSPLRNVTNMSNVHQAQGHYSSVAVINNRDIISPSTPETASALFDNFRFTPVTETKPKSHFDYLTSLSTPVTINREDVSFIDDGATKENSKPSTRQLSTVIENITTDPRKVIQFDEIDDGTFLKSQEEIDEIEIIFSEQSEPNRTKVLSNPVIRIIEDETKIIYVEKTTEQTFKLNKSQSLNVIAGRFSVLKS